MSFMNQQQMYDSVFDTKPSVVYATVSGFTEKKVKYWFSDYLFVLEVFWTNKRTTYIRRNYEDVLKLHHDLKDYFNNEYHEKLIKAPIFIPELEGRRFLQKNCIDVAEHREMELQRFFKQLLENNRLISSNNIVLSFFGRRHTDPVPCETSQSIFPVEDDGDDEDDILFNR